MVFPLAPSVGNDFDVLARYYRAGYGYVSLTIAGDDCGLAEAMHRLAAVRREIDKRPDYLVLALSVDDVKAAHKCGKLAVGLHLEGTECLERDVDMIDVFYSLGIRHAILAFNQNNSAAGGCSDLGDVGLSRLGRRFLERMRSVGMLLDLSHMSERSSLEALEYIAVPVVFTHSNSRALYDHYRNVSDAQARACASTGGLVGVSGSSAYIGEHEAPLQGMFRHLDHLVQLVGPDHVGLGTDYVVNEEAIVRICAARPDEWPTDEIARYDRLSYVPPEAILELIALMERAGYPQAAIGKILGTNYLRVCAAVWR